MTQTTPLPMPTFDFSAPVLVNDTEAVKLLNADKIAPNAEHILEVLKSEWKGTLDKDQTWGKMQFIFGLPGTILVQEGDKLKPKTADGNKFATAIYHTLLFPLTSKNLYNDERAPQQAERFVKFMQAFGIEASIGSYAAASQALMNYSEFKGKKILGYVGYETDHIEFSEGRFIIANKQGKPAAFEGNSFASKDQAQGAAIKFGFKVDEAFLKIKRFSPVEGAALGIAKDVPVEEEY